MTAEQALQILYQAARRAMLSADDHEIIRQAAEFLMKAIKDREEEK